MEECSEIIKACSKAIRFKLTGHHPKVIKDHAHEIVTEFYELQSIIEYLQDINALPKLNSNEVLHIKQDKIRRIQKYYEEEKKVDKNE